MEVVIDKCNETIEELQSPNRHGVKVAQGEMLRDIVTKIKGHSKQLVESREKLQILWRQAQARLVQASQLKDHQRNTKKVGTRLLNNIWLY